MTTTEYLVVCRVLSLVLEERSKDGYGESIVYRWTPHKRQRIGIVDRGFKLGSQRWKGQDGARKAETLPEAIPGVKEVYINSEVRKCAGSNAKHCLGRLKQIVEQYS
mgnify:CR=1 FL=1